MKYLDIIDQYAATSVKYDPSWGDLSLDCSPFGRRLIDILSTQTIFGAVYDPRWFEIRIYPRALRK